MIFEKDLFSVFNKIIYTTASNTLLMKEYTDKIGKTDNIVIKSDKMGNYYYISVDDYQNAICNRVNKIYK